MRIVQARPLLALLSAFALAGCSAPNVDVGSSIKVVRITTGWFDAGIVAGKNKLVPSATFSVTNTGTETLSGLQVYTVFRLAGESEELGSSLVVLRGKEALGPGGVSKPITVRANWGFTGVQPRAQMLMNAYFKDANIEVFAKFGSPPFVKVGEAKISRQLLTQYAQFFFLTSGTKRTGMTLRVVVRPVPSFSINSRSCTPPTGPTGITRRPPGLSWATSADGTASGAAVTTMMSNGAASGQP